MTATLDLGPDLDALIPPVWKGRRVAVAMSGGVDSSVTAVLCALAGCDVIGITMKLWDYESVGGDTNRDGRCCTVEAFDRCRAVAAQYDFPHYTIDLRENFEKCVVDNFVAEYRRGRTPNPCIICNVDIKWGQFWEKARAFGCEAMATGHYAELSHGGDQSVTLKRGLDRSRDQTYFLWAVAPEQFRHTMFPLGTVAKDRVRDLAKRLGLATAETPESRDICFVDDDDLGRFMKERDERDGISVSGGPIVSRDGTELGRHGGVAAYTIGQRKGLGVAVGRPQYVTAIDPIAQTVTIGDDLELFARRFRVVSLNCLADPLQDGSEVHAQIRYRHQAAPARLLQVTDESVDVEFEVPQRAITPGQSAVFYDDDRLIGGGVIETVLPATDSA